MDILDLSTEILKDLIFNHILIEATKNKYSEDFFVFKWNDNKDSIIYEDVDLVVYGNSCWEDSKEEKKHTSVYTFDYSNLGEFFNSFLLSQDIIKKQYPNNFSDYLKYLDNYKNDDGYHYFIYNETREEEYDSYYNYNRVRTLIIDVESILKHLKDLNASKNLTEVSSIFYNLHKDNLQSILLFSHLDNQLPEKSLQSKRKKI